MKILKKKEKLDWIKKKQNHKKVKNQINQKCLNCLKTKVLVKNMPRMMI